MGPAALPAIDGGAAGSNAGTPRARVPAHAAGPGSSSRASGPCATGRVATRTADAALVNAFTTSIDGASLAAAAVAVGSAEPGAAGVDTGTAFAKTIRAISVAHALAGREGAAHAGAHADVGRRAVGVGDARSARSDRAGPRARDPSE